MELKIPDTERAAHVLRINDLPNELLIHIFSMVDFESLLAVANVCIRWQLLCLRPFVWNTPTLTVCVNNFVKVCNKIIMPYIAKYIKKVKLHYFKLYSHVWTYFIKYCPNLTHLEISVRRIDSCIFNEFSNLPNLKFLSFRNSLIVQSSQDQNENNYIYYLPFDKLKNLETLILSNFSLSHDSLCSMLQCNSLVNINMEKIKNISPDFLKMLLETKQSTLKALYIYGDTLNDDIISSISKCKVLQVLHIMTCKTLTDSSLLHLNKLTLRSLKLRHGYFSSDALLAYFSRNVFQQLTYLSLSRCLHVNMEIVKVIKLNAPNLQDISFYSCPFISAPDFKKSELLEMFQTELLLD